MNKCEPVSAFSDVNELDSYYVLSVLSTSGKKYFFGGLLFLTEVEQALKFESAEKAINYFKSSYIFEDGSYAEFWKILIKEYKLDESTVNVEMISTKSINVLSVW